jgi:16S rRNA (guanine(966)-N(2))-methyltransferase RsmD
MPAGRKIMRTQLRIVAGSLRGRKLTCSVNTSLRPTPQMVREALFSILGNAVPDRPFLDVFAGTGVVGLEALSRGASSTLFVERDFRLIADLERHIRAFGVQEQAHIARSDVYRWIERWQTPDEPVTVFLSPPFNDFTSRLEELFGVIGQLQNKAKEGSVVVLQAEKGVPLFGLPQYETWDQRTYGRNLLLIWVKEPAPPSSPPEGLPHDAPPRD